MRYRKILLLFLFSFFGLRAFAATFVVTSNADSGQGTLRDALTQAAANGSATKDYINFNLPGNSETDRTITILSQLPFISSNLVIDGTSQPGSNLGRSDAKIILQPGVKNTDTYSPLFHLFVLLDIDGFELYGMSIRDFIGSVPTDNYTNFIGALDIEESTNIQIGAPGKGNVFANNSYNIKTSVFSIKDGKSVPAFGAGNLKIWSNLFGFEPDGKTSRGGILGYIGGIDISACKGDIEIGGEDPLERNFFTNGAMYIEQKHTSLENALPSSILIKNNFFNYDLDGNPTAIPTINASEIFAMILAGEDLANTDDHAINPYTINIINNKFLFPYSISGGYISGDFTMQGNQLLNDPKQSNPGYGGGIGAAADGSILVGGLNPGEANVLYGEEVDLFSRKSLLLQHNSIYCMGDFRGVWYPNVAFTTPPLPLPTVNINVITPQSISGTATPLSKIELFWDDDCYYCEPLTYVTTVQADNNGNWLYNGPVKTGVVASAELNGFTSVFTKHAVYEGGNVKHAACGNNGSITGGIFQNTGGYQWKNSNGEIIRTTPDINGLAPGTYTLTALNSSCSRDYTFTIFDATPKIDDSQKRIIQPSCGNSKGSITGLYLDNFDVINDANIRETYNIYTYKWVDAGGNIASTSLDLNDVAAGTYTLQVTYENACTVNYGPIILKNVAGPNIDQTPAVIQPTNCGQSKGSITNLVVTGTGTLKYIWWNSQQQTVSTTKDLTGQPAGIYKLEVTDDSQCGPVYTTDITIPQANGITLDESKAQTSVASCSKDNGSVTGITATGATQYQWTDANNKIWGTSVDMQNAAPGDYTLTASNSFGCSAKSKPYHVGQQPPTQFPVYPATIISTCTGQSNGSITVTTDNLVSSVRWVNSQGQTTGTSQPAITGIAAGTYHLFLTDVNGCENLYNSYNVLTIPQLQIVPGSEQVTNDQCALKTGGITNIQVTGGTLPYSYSWLDANKNVVSSSVDLSAVGQGSYTLNVNDASGCGLVSAVYTVQNQNNTIPAPAASNVQLCSPGSALLQVSNPSSVYSYRLYDSKTSTTPLDEQANGIFKITVKTNTDFYVSQVSGACESARTDVQVNVGITSVDIANTFTPNGDGINDYWKIKGIENYPNATVQIFTRYGQKIFESRGYPTSFDGTLKGKPLPAGVYYYIINLSTNCNLLSGSLTIIR